MLAATTVAYILSVLSFVFNSPGRVVRENLNFPLGINKVFLISALFYQFFVFLYGYSAHSSLQHWLK